MPIEYRVDQVRRVVLSRAQGVMTDDDVFGYQREVWSRPDVFGFSEIIDMTECERIALPSNDRVEKLATLSASMDPQGVDSKFAIVAPGDLAFGLGRMFEAHRSLHPQSTKQVRVFRAMPEALAWLGIEATWAELWS